MTIAGTEFVKIVGIEKNGSSSIRALIKNYDFISGWQKIPDIHFPNLYTPDIYFNPSTVFFIPLRDEFKRVQSGLIQDIHDILVELGIEEKIHVINFVKRFCVEYPAWHSRKASRITWRFSPSFAFYLEADPIKFFYNNVFMNKDWVGAKFYFFDLNAISKDSFIKECGKYDERFITEEVKMPATNTIQENILKTYIIEAFDEIPQERLLRYDDPGSYSEKIQENIISNRMFFTMIKKSKYYLNLLK